MSAIAPALDLLLIRHAATAWSEAGRYQGRSDPPLSSAGQAAAALLARRLAGQSIGLVLSSPLARALETARPLATVAGAPLHTDARLAELEYGHWEGLTQAEIKARWPADLRAWKRAPASARPTGGETLAAAAARLADLLADLPRRAAPGRSVAIVTHTVLIRLALLAARGKGPEALRSLTVDPASAHRLRLYDGRLGPADPLHSNPVPADA